MSNTPAVDEDQSEGQRLSVQAIHDIGDRTMVVDLGTRT
jgi:hypothetical protein